MTNIEKPVPPRPECVGGTREDWYQYHIDAYLYYTGKVMTLEELKERLKG